MKRFAVAVGVVVLSALQADAQISDGGPLYHSPYSAPNPVGRYYPVSGSGFYMQQSAGFGGANCPTGVVGVPMNSPSVVYPSGIVLANPISPGNLYNDALYNSFNSFAPGSGTPGYFGPGYGSSRFGMIRRYP